MLRFYLICGKMIMVEMFAAEMMTFVLNGLVTQYNTCMSCHLIIWLNWHPGESLGPHAFAISMRDEHGHVKKGDKVRVPLPSLTPQPLPLSVRLSVFLFCFLLFVAAYPRLFNSVCISSHTYSFSSRIPTSPPLIFISLALSISVQRNYVLT